jgi:hypothetical protein
MEILMTGEQVTGRGRKIAGAVILDAPQTGIA